MCPPRPPKSIALILFEACEDIARSHPELLFPDRYYTADDQLDWSGRTISTPAQTTQEARCRG